ncbi:MAG TPA: hypothetical protein PLE74_09480 [Candidatus Cloacimonadota bacterium]|nr:hypothetical protein [Candidatus Cloacimonadota bacterium]HPT72496.1 hypothetical protein [Candidatus Cloacimonadota bacterium]
MKKEDKRFWWSPLNTILLIVALVVMTAGYIIMRQNDISVSPVLLVIAYVVLIPLAIMLKGKKDNN